jgi:hypothetical protein
LRVLILFVVAIATESFRVQRSINMMNGDRVEVVDEFQHPRWEQMWKDGISAGERFDTGTVSPYLAFLLSTGQVLEGRALVPGCGIVCQSFKTVA